RWFRAGADRDKIDQLKTGRDFIKQAIELNPNAHFGREKYQLMVMEWVISGPSMNGKSYLPNLLGSNASHHPEDDPKARQDLEDAIKGLSGLIVLGDAWQSFDVFYALALALNASAKSGPAYLAYLRCLELIDQGRGSIVQGSEKGEALKK